MLLRIPHIQRHIAGIATEELSDRLGVPVKIDRVDIEWFNRLVLEGVYLEDEQGEVLLEANHIAAGFEVLPLLKGKFVFTTARLFGFSMNLTKDTPHDKLNLQFVIDAFSTNDSIKKKREIDLRFNSILIRRGNFTYNVLSEKHIETKFDPNHVDISNLSANISLKAFNKDSLNANIKRISFNEASGFTLNKLSLNLISNHEIAYIQNFEIRLPETHLKIDQAKIDISQADSVQQLVNEAPLVLTIAPSQICLRDLSAFVPAFRNFIDPIEMSAEASGYINDIDLSRLTLQYSDKMLFVGKMSLKGITTPEEAYILGEVNRMYITSDGLSGIINNFSSQPVQLPEQVIRLGTINFTGEISGFFDNLVAYGNFTSAVGSVKTDVLFGNNKEKNIAAYISGHVSSTNLRLNELFPANNSFGIASFDVNVDISRPANGTYGGKVSGHIKELDYNNYRYENIRLSGRFDKNSYNGMVEVDDPNGALYAEGMFRNQGPNSVFNFTANLKHFRPDNLNFTTKYDSPEISLNLYADFTGNNIDNAEGSILIDSLSFSTAPSDFYLKRMEMVASGYAENRKLTIQSDIINGEVTGVYSFSTFIPSVLQTIHGYIPALIETKSKKGITNENNFSLLLTLENTEDLSNTLKLPVTILNPSRITGHYNNLFNKFRVEAYLPSFKIGNSFLEGGYLTMANPRNEIDLQIRATNYNNKGLRNYLQVKADASDNTIHSLVSWANNKDRLFKADISTTTTFFEDEGERGRKELRTEIAINESPFVINDTIWQIAPAHVSVKNGIIDVNHFKIGDDSQHILIDGRVSHNPADTLLLDLNQIELSYIFDILNNPVLQFAGKATGIFHLSDLYGSRILNTDLEVQNFSFNQVNFGQLNLFSEWDDTQQGILMLGTIYKNDSTWTDVNGYIFPVGERAGLSLYFDANDIDVAFIQPFMQNVANNVQGRGFGNVHLYGPFSSLTIEGDAYVENGGLGIDFTNTYYTFSDSIHMRPTTIYGRDMTIYDKDGNSGKVNLTLNHQHFRDLDFDVRVDVQNMLVYNTTERQNPLIYGTVYGTGSGTIRGNEKIIDFDVNMRNDPKTHIYLNFMSGSTAAEYDFITFIDKSKTTHENGNGNGTNGLALDSISPFLPVRTQEGAELRMNFLVDVTPEAEIEMIMDPVAGDRIRGHGSGSLQVQYGTKSDLRMYGGFHIIDGRYNFSLQQLFFKEFKIREGSSVTFQGDPFYANLDIDGVYSTYANLNDLSEDLARESARTTILVNAILKVDGMLYNPSITFDLEFPNTNTDLANKIRGYINTEDMVTRQIVYLLVLNKFAPPEFTNEPRSNEFGALASSALSYQLSSILNTITDKVQIGTNIRTGQEGFTDTEVEMLLSSQLLNNRLIFNGNFGYRNNVEQGNVFVGEFDIEYLLTRSGEIRVKFYNHANELYNRYLNQSLTTQGLGLMYKKDFNSLSEIFRRRRKQLPVYPPADTKMVLPDEEEIELLEEVFPENIE